MDGWEGYEFGEFILDVPERQLTKGEERISLAPKSMTYWSCFDGMPAC